MEADRWKEESLYLAELMKHYEADTNQQGSPFRRPPWSTLAEQVNKKFKRNKTGSSVSQHYKRGLF